MSNTLHEGVVSGFNHIYDNKQEVLSGSGVFIICNKTKRILLGKRSAPDFHAGHWCGFGGTIEPGEQPLDTAIREINEEASISPDMIDISPNELYFDVDPISNFTFKTYLGISENEFDVKLNKEHDDYGWFSLMKLPSPMHPGVNRLLSNPHAMRIILNNMNG